MISLPFEAGFISWETLWVWLFTPFLSGCTNPPWFCGDWKLFTPPWLRYGCCWPTENASRLGGNLPPDITYHTFKTRNMVRCWVESNRVLRITFQKRECTQFSENFVKLTPACSHEMQIFWVCAVDVFLATWQLWCIALRHLSFVRLRSTRYANSKP